MKTDQENIKFAISNSIKFLAEHQLHHGEFITYMGPDEALTEWVVPDNTNFTTATICNLLLPMKSHPLVDGIIQKAIAFFKYQRMRGGLWHYYATWHKQFSIMSPDADTTSCVSAFLTSAGAPFPRNLPLLLANRDKHGLFYTWFTFRMQFSNNTTYWKVLLRELKHPVATHFFWKKVEGSRNDIDAGVNANVLYYIGLNDYTAPIVPFLLKIINDHKEADCDKWYRNPLVIYYFISRNYYKGIASLHPARDPIIRRIEALIKPGGLIGNSSFDTALALNTLLNFNYDVNNLTITVNYLLSAQAANGSWPRNVFYWGGPAKKIGWGAEALSTAFCLEGLARYYETVNNKKPNGIFL